MPYLSCHRCQALARYSRNAVYLGNEINTDELDQVKQSLHPKTLKPNPYFRYTCDHPFKVSVSDACYPPLMVLTLAGVTKAPIFPKGGGRPEQEQV